MTNSIAYTGAVLDDETGLYYMNARYYDPATGRFISMDSYRGNGESFWHLYAYCDGDPVNSVDPTGHAQEKTKTALAYLDGYLSLRQVKYRLEVKYQYTTKEIKKINNTTAYVVYNRLPTLRTAFEDKSSFIKAGKTHVVADARFSYELSLLQWGIVRLGTVKLHIEGDRMGRSVNGWIKLITW